MAVLGRVLLNSAERIDLPDLLSIDSYGAGDWKFFMQSLVGTSKPYVLYGFDVINPSSAIGLPTCSIRVADSIVYYPGAAAGPFFYGLPEDNEASAPLVPSLRTNAANYVYLTLSTFDTASDTRALWDPDRNGGDGGEFTQEINTESVIQAQLGVSTGSFPVNTVPLAVIVVGASAITSITDARDMMFRLGTGGIAPDSQAEYAFPSLPDGTHARLETSSTISSPANPNPFQGGDKNIKTLKQWMDAVMTKLKELGGTTYWYEDTTTFSLLKIWQDALATAWKSKGKYTHSSATPGLLSWNEDLYIKSMSSPLDIVIRTNAGPLQLENEQVAFLNLIRDLPINTLDEAVVFEIGKSYINSASGAAGVFGELQKGDWVKKVTDKDTLYLQVREFYDTAQTSNTPSGIAVPANSARAITLSAAYAGTSETERARFTRGEYTTGDIVIVNRDDNMLNEYAGNMLWFAQRSDTRLPISSISAITLSGTISADGAQAVASSVGHGLVDGDRIIVTAPVAYGSSPYYVEVIDADNFTFKTTITSSSAALTGYYGLCTTQADTVNSFQLESANHGFDSGDTIIITDTANFDGDYVVNVRSSTQFQFPIASAPATEAPPADPLARATLARLDVRSEEGIQKIVQGETINIGSGTIDDMQAFIGMTSLDQTSPVYTLPGSYGTLNAGANYNGLVTDNLTARVSKNTAMIMDKAQDKTVKYLTDAISCYVVFNSPTHQAISFTPPASTLTILQPGGVGNATVTLPDVGAPLTLAVNQSAYVEINRNASSTPSIIVTDTATVPVSENIFVIASRLGGSEIYLWDGTHALSTTPIKREDIPLVQCDYFDPESTSLPTGGSVIVDANQVFAGDLVVFSNLSSGNNRLYEAVGVGGNITSWNALYKFNGWQNPEHGDTLLVKKGQGFTLQIGKFDALEYNKWIFNQYVRHFNGADYFEQSSLMSTTLADNATTQIFSVLWTGNEHMLIDYSIVRDTARETGTMRIVTDGALAEVSTDSAYVNGNSGVTFSATIAFGTNLVLSGVTTSTGTAAQLKYSVRRWSSSPGGAGGIPSYSGAAAPLTPAGGPVNSVQFNSGGNLAGNSNFEIDTVDISMSFNGLRQGVLSEITVLDNQAAPATLVLLDDTYSFYILDYSVSKEGFVRIGHLKIASDGTNVVINDDGVETGATGIVFSASVVVGGIQLYYTTTNGAGDGVFKYTPRKWI